MLRKILRNMMERKDKDATNRELASVTGTCDATFTNFFNYDQDLSMSHWVLIIRHLDPLNEEQLIRKIAEEEVKNENRLNCRILMEYASISRNFALLEYLIQTQLKAPKENKDWAEVYSYSLLFQKREIPDSEILKKLKCYKPKYLETRVFSSILESRIYYMLKEYKTMFRIAEETKDDIAQIKNEYIRDSYMSRLCEVFAQGYLYLKADNKKARFYANQVINSKYLCAKFTSHMYHLLGTSFVFENLEKSLEYFTKYRELLEQQGRSELANTVTNNDIAFTKNLWGQISSEEETDDQLEKLHYHARNGNINEVTNIELNNDCSTPFALCYLGIAKKDPLLLMQSLAKFIEIGNKFFADFPRKELAKYPMFEASANVIYGINIA